MGRRVFAEDDASSAPPPPRLRAGGPFPAAPPVALVSYIHMLLPLRFSVCFCASLRLSLSTPVRLCLSLSVVVYLCLAHCTKSLLPDLRQAAVQKREGQAPQARPRGQSISTIMPGLASRWRASQWAAGRSQPMPPYKLANAAAACPLNLVLTSG